MSDTDSNSTDYGISHANELLKPGVLDNSATSRDTLQTEEGYSAEDNSNKPIMSDIPELEIIENRINSNDEEDSLEREEGGATFGNSVMLLNNKFGANLSLSPMRKKQKLEKRNVSASPNPRSKSAWKRKLDPVVSGVTNF